MIADLSRLVAAPGAHSVPYIDPLFPDRPLVLHGAWPRDFAPRRRCCSCIMASAATVRLSGLLAETRGRGRHPGDRRRVSRASFPEYLRYHFGNLHDEDGTPNPRAWTYRHRRTLVRPALRAQGVTARGNLWFVRPFRRRAVRPPHAVVRLSAIASRWPSAPMPAPMRCRIWMSPWPFGLGRDGCRRRRIAELLRFRITVMAGTADIKTTGRFFPKGPRSMRQGTRAMSARTTMSALGRSRRRAGHALCLGGDRRARRRP